MPEADSIIGLRNVAPRQGTEIGTIFMQGIGFSLRNVAPRQGTEIFRSCTLILLFYIEKCSSPIGDGNAVRSICKAENLSIEKCSSPIGDGNRSYKDKRKTGWKIEKCSSPIGDGNNNSSRSSVWFLLIEKCSSPIGDGNTGPTPFAQQPLLRNVAPRQGTETQFIHASVNPLHD